MEKPAGSALNFIKAIDPRKIALPKLLAKGLVPLGIFITGYSAAPASYAEPTQRYEEALVDNLKAQGHAPVFITSPTVTPGSIDAIGTAVAHKKKTDILYITATDFLEYVDPDRLPEGADKKRFIKAPKYYFDSKPDYSLASAVASDITEVTGGRDTAVLDFEHALQEHKKILLVHNSKLPTGFDAVKNRPENAEEYLEAMIHSSIEGKALPYPAVRGFDAAYMERNRDALMDVKIDNVYDPKFLTAPTVRELWGGSALEGGRPVVKPVGRKAKKPVAPKGAPTARL